jgi:uncharacterized membrane protein YgaE (UPF0421/DUF939 family)
MRRLTTWHLAYALNMAIACGISYAMIIQALAPFVNKHDDLLGGMWAVVATVFVFRDTRASSLTAGLARLIATSVSIFLCFIYLLMFPFSGLGMIVVIGVGTLAMTLLGRPDDIVTTGITTAVVLVVAALSSESAWQEPLLRFVDTVVGIAIGLSCKWIGSYAFCRVAGEPVRQ